MALLNKTWFLVLVGLGLGWLALRWYAQHLASVGVLGAGAAGPPPPRPPGPQSDGAVYDANIGWYVPEARSGRGAF